MAEQESKAQIVQKQIPINILLMHYGKSQIQLVAAEEELNQARAIIESLQKTAIALRAEMQKQTEELQALKAAASETKTGPILVPETAAAEN